MSGTGIRDIRTSVAGDAVRCVEFGLEDMRCWMQPQP